MRTKAGTSRERTIIYNVFAYIKSIFPDESQRDLLIRTVKAKGSIYTCTSVKRIVKENEDTKSAVNAEKPVKMKIHSLKKVQISQKI